LTGPKLETQCVESEAPCFWELAVGPQQLLLKSLIASCMYREGYITSLWGTEI